MESNHQLNDSLLHIGKKIANMRRAKNEKLSNVAKAINISPGTMSRIENGQYSHLNMKLILKLCNNYNITISDLFASAPDSTGT